MTDDTPIPSTDAWEGVSMDLVTSPARDFRTFHLEPAPGEEDGNGLGAQEVLVDMMSIDAVLEDGDGAVLLVRGARVPVVETYRETLALLAKAVL